MAGGGGQQVPGVHLSRLSTAFARPNSLIPVGIWYLDQSPRTASKETDPAMEPASLPVTKGRGSIEDPEVLENVPGHVIPILEREFDDFDTEAAKFLRGETPETEFIGFRLKQGVYGQRQPDVQMIRVKLPMGGITPEQLEAFADVIEQLRAAQQGPHHDAPEHPDPPHPAATTRPSSSARSPTPACPAARAAATRCATSPATRGPASRADELFDLTPYAGAYVRYFVRHPTTQLMPRKVKTAFDASPEDRALTGIHDIAFIARERDGAARRRGPRRRRHVDHAARRADALRLRRPRRRRVPARSPRPSSASSTARTGCASTAPAPASRCSSTRSASTRCAG